MRSLVLRRAARSRGLAASRSLRGAVRIAALHGVWLVVASLPWLLTLLAA